MPGASLEAELSEQDEVAIPPEWLALDKSEPSERLRLAVPTQPLTLASDFSGLVYLWYSTGAAWSLLNALLFLFYYRLARPKGLRRTSAGVVWGALLFTLVGPGGFWIGTQVSTRGVHGALDSFFMAGVPSLAGSLLLTTALMWDVRARLVWLAPLIGTALVVALASALPHPGDQGPLSLLLWPIPWHLVCAPTILKAGRAAWREELANTCGSCGYPRRGLTGQVCPECGQPLGGEHASSAGVAGGGG